MADFAVTPPGESTAGAALVDVALAGLPAGEFLIEVAARSADGVDVTELVAFRMVG